MICSKTSFIRLFVVVALFAVISFPRFSYAIEYGMLGGKPVNPDPQIKDSASWFIYGLAAGESKEDAVKVMNLFDQSLDVMVYAADTTKSSGGGFALDQFSEPKDEVGSWVRFYPTNPPEKFAQIFESKDKKIIELCKTSKEEIQGVFEKDEKELLDDDFSELEQWCQGKDFVELQMQANEQRDISFVIRVPEGADVGEHTGGILIQKKAVEDAGNSGGSAVKLTTRIGVRIYETVPGEIIKKISLDDFKVAKNFKEFSFSDWFGKMKSPREYLVETKIFNSGNVSILHDNNVYVTDALFGKQTEKIERNFQVLKADKFIANYSWKKPLFGYYKFQGEIKYQGNNGEEILKTNVISLWVIPWREITLFALIVVMIVAGYWLWRRSYKKKYGGIGWASYEVKENETVAHLAERYQIDWSVLAKTNKLRAPYLLTAGQTVLVPPSKDEKKTNDAKVVGEGEKVREISGESEEASENDEVKIELNGEGISIDEILKKSSAEKSYKKGNQAVAMESATKDAVHAVELPSKKSLFFGKIKWLILGGVIVVISVMIVAVFLIKQKEQKSQFVSTEISVSTVANKPAVPEEKKEVPKVTEEKKETVTEEIDIAQINIKIFNEGAPAGTAGKIKDFLVSKGYLKTESGNGEKDDVVGSVVVFGDVKFQKDAKWIGNMLTGKGIKAEVREATTDEEKSGDIVIILGK